MGSDPAEELRRFADGVPPATVIQTFDVDFDRPMRHAAAEWLLTIHDAFRPVDAGNPAALTTRVGAYWCRIVSADVRFQLAAGLTAIAESSDDATRLRSVAGAEAGYAAARWADGAGRILYRTGNHTRGRMLFEDACALADEHGLWWCKPDMTSNRLRSQLQEAEQAGNDRLERIAELAQAMRDAVEEQTLIGCHWGVSTTVAPPPDASVHQREFLRGNLSLTHNLSLLLFRLGNLRDDESLRAESGELADRVVELASATGDGYREAQATLQQAQVLRHAHGHSSSKVREKLERIRRLSWERGRLIAEQQIAHTDADEAGMRTLLQHAEDAISRPSGVDLEIASGAVQRAREVLIELPGTVRNKWQERLRVVELKVVRSVRQVIALPSYKRAYAGTVRPIYLAEIRRLLDDASATDTAEPEAWEDIVGLVEESTARELLDMISGAELPQLDPPDNTMTDAAVSEAGVEVEDAGNLDSSDLLVDGDQDLTVAAGEEVAGRRGLSALSPGRRAAPRRMTSPELQEQDRMALLEREKEFERQFLRHPLQAAAHDPEIAAKADGYVANNPGACIVRYFVHGTREDGSPDRLAAVVFRDDVRRPVDCGDLAPIRAVVDRMLTQEIDGRIVSYPDLRTARDIWDLLLAPIWDDVVGGGEDLNHLVVVPTDDLFAVPFQIAVPAGGIPLGARVPLSLSVGLSAFLLRGRSSLRHQRVSASDDLSALILPDVGSGDPGTQVSGNEIAVGWPREHLFLAGHRPSKLAESVEPFDADWAGLARLSAPRPEFFVYAGHGRYASQYGELGPCLQLGRDDRLTSYDVALRLRLPRNRLTILGACLAGQGSGTTGGDVAGFLRAFTAAGAGAIALPLWSVHDDAVVATASRLLRASRDALRTPRRVFDVVGTLHEQYRTVVDRYRSAEGNLGWIERMPLTLYT
ncbi:CHAT domain-containing protein [Pseudonocardia lacus]|uniref:CHAT domain-containing protein n=1 Tax=Pseudonocardia lacus TaxID=2835865 RepID=UPI001BDDB45B|nr:CHAT domain-containing protein [Pseudonocardia lacus]